MPTPANVKLAQCTHVMNAKNLFCFKLACSAQRMRAWNKVMPCEPEENECITASCTARFTGFGENGSERPRNHTGMMKTWSAQCSKWLTKAHFRRITIMSRRWRSKTAMCADIIIRCCNCTRQTAIAVTVTTCAATEMTIWWCRRTGERTEDKATHTTEHNTITTKWLKETAQQIEMLNAERKILQNRKEKKSKKQTETNVCAITKGMIWLHWPTLLSELIKVRIIAGKVTRCTCIWSRIHARETGRITIWKQRWLPGQE